MGVSWAEWSGHLGLDPHVGQLQRHQVGNGGVIGRTNRKQRGVEFEDADRPACTWSAQCCRPCPPADHLGHVVVAAQATTMIDEGLAGRVRVDAGGKCSVPRPPASLPLAATSLPR